MFYLFYKLSRSFRSTSCHAVYDYKDCLGNVPRFLEHLTCEYDRCSGLDSLIASLCLSVVFIPDIVSVL